MNTRRFGWCGVLLGSSLVLLLGIRWLTAAQGPNFDKLADADRQVFADRFKKEIWPLLIMGKKKEDSCVGCHNKTGIVSALKFKNDPDTDFRLLLRDGFLLKDDDGSLLGRIVDHQKKRKMPPGDRPRWTDAEIKVLRAFVNDVHAKQKR